MIVYNASILQDLDEIHIFNKGPMLESIVSRTTREVETCKEVSRMVELSTTLPNYKLWIIDDIHLLHDTRMYTTLQARKHCI